MVAPEYESGSSPLPTSQNLESVSIVSHDSGQSHVPTTVLLPVLIIFAALLIPLWLCVRKLRDAERVMPLYRQEEELEDEPKLCEVALSAGDFTAIPVFFPEPWRRLRPLSIHRHSYQELQKPNTGLDSGSRTSRSLSPGHRRLSLPYSRTDSERISLVSQLRVGVLVSMPSPPLGSGRKTPDDLFLIPDLCIGFKDVHLIDKLP